MNERHQHVAGPGLLRCRACIEAGQRFIRAQGRERWKRCGFGALAWTRDCLWDRGGG